MTKTMKTLLNVSLLALTLGGGSGCAMVSSNHAGLTNTTGEAWYVEDKGFMLLKLASRVFYCPAATSGGPSTCKEAKMVPLTDAENAAQQPPK